MRGIRRAGGVLVAAAAMAAAAAGPAEAMIGPACTARLTAIESNASTCSFDNQYDYATITVVPVDGSVRATIRCFVYGYPYTSSRTVSQPTAYAAWTPGSCSLSLAAVTAGATAVATSTPTTGPIIEPYPVP